MSVPVLFVERNSVYKYLGCDCWDILRDAVTCKSYVPAIYHPPCQSWSKLRHFSKFVPGNHWLGVWAFIRVRRFGGILEQPEGSYLFEYMKAPCPGKGYDEYGGRTILIDQCEYGHPCRKRTLLYIADWNQDTSVRIAFPGQKPTHCIASRTDRGNLPVVPIQFRNYTPIHLARELIRVCELIKPVGLVESSEFGQF